MLPSLLPIQGFRQGSLLSIPCQRRFRLYSMQGWIQARSPKVAEVQVQICQEPPKLLLARALGSAHSKAHSDPFHAAGLRSDQRQVVLLLSRQFSKVHRSLLLNLWLALPSQVDSRD